jgi:hypothetical protein
VKDLEDAVPGRAGDDPLAQMELAFIKEFLERRGYSLTTLRELPHEQADRLLKEASVYASGKLTEVESRAHYVHDVHGDADLSQARRERDLTRREGPR